MAKTIDPSYSTDVEIDHDGTLVWARDVQKGEVVAIPLHMLDKVRRDPETSPPSP